MPAQHTWPLAQFDALPHSVHIMPTALADDMHIPIPNPPSPPPEQDMAPESIRVWQAEDRLPGEAGGTDKSASGFVFI